MIKIALDLEPGQEKLVDFHLHMDKGCLLSECNKFIWMKIPHDSSSVEKSLKKLFSAGQWGLIGTTKLI